MKTKQLFSKTLYTAVFASAMAFGTSSAFAQVKIGTNPTTINAANNLEVEASTAGNKVSVDKTTGKITIADGSQGAAKILTSDANGVATWQSTAAIRVPETVFAGKQGADYVITNFTYNYNVAKDRIPLVPSASSLPGYDATTKQYTIQSNGYYRVTAGAYITGTLPPPTNTTGFVYIYPWYVLAEYRTLSNAAAPVLSTFWEANLSVGDVVDLFVVSQDMVGGAPQNVIVKNGFLTITKLY